MSRRDSVPRKVLMKEFWQVYDNDGTNADLANKLSMSPTGLSARLSGYRKKLKEQGVELPHLKRATREDGGEDAFLREQVERIRANQKKLDESETEGAEAS